MIGPSECCLFERFSTECHKTKTKPMNLFGDAAAVLDAIVSNCYYRMPGVEGGGQITCSMYLPPKHSIIAIEIMEFELAAILPKRSIT